MPARAAAEQLFSALGARVSDPMRDRKYDSARVKIASAAFLPSRVWNDTSVWSASQPSRRVLYVSGRNAGGRYSLEAVHSVGPVTQPADARHTINLTRLSDDDEYAWDTDVAFALGRVGAGEAGAFLGAVFAGAEGGGGDETRAIAARLLPHASAVFTTLFRIDTLATTQLADGSTLTAVALTVTPAGIEARYPNFARYMKRYAQTAKMSWTVADHAGAAFFEMQMQAGRMRLRVRTQDGKIVALSGPPRALPDSLTLNGGFTMKVRAFTVGFREYHGDLVLLRTEHERAWNFVSRREPEWVLPLITERLLRTPLRRPFQGSGATFRIGVRDDTASGQTILHRRMHLEVQESMILRFIGRLGAIAISDYTGKAETEQYAWAKELLDALVQDIRVLQ